jgi:DNA repair ATPase RecN
MSERDLIREYKNTISDLTKEKDDAIKLVSQKESKIKQLFIQVEQATQDVQNMGKRIAELEFKLKKKQEIKRVIDKKITEILENTEENKEKKDAPSVDKGGADMLKEFYEK